MGGCYSVIHMDIATLLYDAALFIKVPFTNKGIEFIDLHSIFKNRSVTSSIVSYFKNSDQPIIYYKNKGTYEMQYLTSINVFLILISMLTPLSHETVKILSLVIR